MIENKDMYKKIVDDSSVIRYEINTQHQKKMNKICRLFKDIFEQDPKIFTFIKNLRYYLGGYPRASSAPKLFDVCDRFATAIKYYHFMGRLDDVNTYLSDMGIEVKITNEIKNDDIDIFDFERSKKKRKYQAIFGDREIPKTKKDFFNLLLDEALQTQAIICEKADLIKVNANEVEEKCKIKKPHFIEAVSLGCKQIKKTYINPELDNINKKIESQKDSISIFERIN